MAKARFFTGDKSPPEDRCWVSFEGDPPCPNKAEWRVVNLEVQSKKGYSLMCDPHKRWFSSKFPRADVTYVRYGVL